MSDKSHPIIAAKALATVGRNRARLDVQTGAERLARYFGATVELMQVLARACGHADLSDLTTYDITTWKREMSDLSGIAFAGLSGSKLT